MEISPEAPMRKRNAWWMVIALLCAGAWTDATAAQSQALPQSQPQSQQNPDAAKDANDKSKNDRKSSAPRKVYTNDDLTGLEKDGVSVVGGKQSDGKTAKCDTTKAGKQNEAYWRGRAQNLRNQMAEVDRQIAQLTGTTQTNGSDTGNATTPPQGVFYVGGRGARLQNLQNRKAALQKQMDQLVEEARKASVPPGWLR
jgi:hypothetical protein